MQTDNRFYHREVSDGGQVRYFPILIYRESFYDGNWVYLTYLDNVITTRLCDRETAQWVAASEPMRKAMVDWWLVQENPVDVIVSGETVLHEITNVHRMVQVGIDALQDRETIITPKPRSATPETETLYMKFLGRRPRYKPMVESIIDRDLFGRGAYFIGCSVGAGVKITPLRLNFAKVADVALRNTAEIIAAMNEAAKPYDVRKDENGMSWVIPAAFDVVDAGINALVNICAKGT